MSTANGNTASERIGGKLADAALASAKAYADSLVSAAAETAQSYTDTKTAAVAAKIPSDQVETNRQDIAALNTAVAQAQKDATAAQKDATAAKNAAAAVSSDLSTEMVTRQNADAELASRMSGVETRMTATEELATQAHAEVTTAQEAATTAKNAATASATSATNAQTSASAAAISAENAENTADNAEKIAYKALAAVITFTETDGIITAEQAVSEDVLTTKLASIDEDNVTMGGLVSALKGE